MELLNRCNCWSNKMILSVLITVLFLLRFGSSLTEKCDSLDVMLKKMNGTTKNDTHTVQCQHEGLACAKYSCQVHFIKANKTVTLKGSFGCEKAKPSYILSLIDRGITNQMVITNKNSTNTFKNVVLSASVSFSQPNATTGEREVKGTLSISLGKVEVLFPPMLLSVSNLVCTCPNLDNLNSQLKNLTGSSKPIDISCWPGSTNCSSFLCRAQTQAPNAAFSFHGSVYCQAETPVYFLLFDGLLKPGNTGKIIKSLMTNGTGTDVIFDEKMNLREADIAISMLVKANATFNQINSTLTRMTSSVTVENNITMGRQFSTIIPFSVTLDFKLNCKTVGKTTTTTTAATTTAATTTAATTTAATTTAATTAATTTAATTTAATTTAATTTTTTTAATTTTPPPPTTSTNGTASPTKNTASVKNTISSSKKSGHKPARAVLIILAVLIVVAVILVGIYFKRKKRLSNQPAYYNDIAINDPLHYELDGEDDELPLFS